MSDINRRQWQRLEITEPTMALDAQGRELGKIVQASGGGIALVPGPGIAGDLNVGQIYRLTIVELVSKTQNTIDVAIRHNDGERIGLEFVTGNPASDAAS